MQKRNMNWKSLHLLQEFTFNNDADVEGSWHELFALANTITDKQSPAVWQRSKWLVSILNAFSGEILQHSNTRHRDSNVSKRQQNRFKEKWHQYLEKLTQTTKNLLQNVLFSK